MVAAADVLQWGRERARAGPWRGQSDVACLSPLPQGPPPSPRFVRHCVDTLRSRGFAEVITSALTPAEAAGFLSAGFVEHERLRLLAHDLSDVPAAPPVVLRRGRRADWPTVLEIDSAAFDPFWRLDAQGLQDALLATPSSRFRVAVEDDDRVVGYAVSGRAGAQGYLQRLAVYPGRRRRGTGTALTVDALTWMRRRGVQRAVVNTQPGNRAALSLYARVGFRPESSDLAVLSFRLGA